MSIASSITALQTAKTNIAAAITAKGGTVNAGDGMSDFAEDIATIPTGGSQKTQDIALSSTRIIPFVSVQIDVIEQNTGSQDTEMTNAEIL